MADKEIRLNLGCGDDIRKGYLNVDLNVSSPDVVKHDVCNLQGLVLKNSVSEILASSIIEYIPFDKFPIVIKSWIETLKSGGQIYIESLDYNKFGIMIEFEHVDIGEINKQLYSGQKSIYNVINLELLLRQLGMKTITKGFKESKFFIMAEKI